MTNDGNLKHVVDNTLLFNREGVSVGVKFNDPDLEVIEAECRDSRRLPSSAELDHILKLRKGVTEHFFKFLHRTGNSGNTCIPREGQYDITLYVANGEVALAYLREAQQAFPRYTFVHPADNESVLQNCDFVKRI